MSGSKPLTPSSSGDVHSAAARVKGRLPGSTPDAENKLEGYGAEAGAKIDKAVCIRLVFVIFVSSSRLAQAELARLGSLATPV